MWSLYMAGGSGAWYDTDAAWDFIRLPPTTDAAPAGYRWVSHLGAFWAGVDRAALRMCGGGTHSPTSALYIHDAAVQGHCIRSASRDAAVLYLWARSRFTYRPDAPAGELRGVWYDPLTGRNATFAAKKTPVASLTLEAPPDFEGDAVLHLTHRAQRL